MLFPVVKALLGHYRRYPLQFLLVWIGLTLGVSLLIGVTTISSHARLGYEQAQILVNQDVSINQLVESINHSSVSKSSSRSQLEALAQAFNMNLQALGLLAFLVGLFIFYQAMSLSFIQRQPLVGMLRQAGVSRLDLAKAIFIEIVILVFFSWVSGNLLGLLLADQLLPSLSLTSSVHSSSGLWYIIDWWWCFYSLILTILGAAAACVWPIIRLLKAPPIRLTERLSLVRYAGKEFNLQAIIAVGLGIAALFLYKLKSFPLAGFGMLTLILVSVALFTPFVVWKMFDFLSYRLSGVRRRWFFADAAASMSYRGIATMAFLIALATNIAAETMVSSFRQTTSQWLEHRLVADLYFYVEPGSADSVEQWLSDQPEVLTIWQRWETQLATSTDFFQVVSTGLSEAEANAMTIKVAVPEYWYDIQHTKGLLISESAASKLGLKPGDQIDLPNPMGQGWRVSGVYYDYGNPYSQILIAEPQWHQYFGYEGEIVFASVLNSEQALPVIREKLLDQTFFSVGEIFDNQQIRKSVLSAFNKTFAVAATLDNITLLIAVCGIFVATLAGEVARQRHFTLLRCFGVSACELILIGGLQLLTFGLICLAIALPMGIFLAQLILDTTVKGTFGWSIPIHYYYSADFVTTALWSLFALVCAGAIPVIRLVVRSPMEVLRHSQ